MRTALAALATLLLIASASAQMSGHDAYPEDHQIRVAYGDIPSSWNDTVEPADQWNVQQSQTIAAGELNATFILPPGHEFVNAVCSCGPVSGVGDNDLTYTISRFDDSEDAVIYFWHSAHGAAETFAAHFITGTGAHLFAYVPNGAAVAGSTEPSSPGVSATRNDVTIYDFGAVGPSAWFVVSPEAIGTAPEPADGFTLDFTQIAIGLLAGILLWSVLVSRGIVQKRQRKQVAAVAAHKQVAAAESKESLEGRKRALMAALKELEKAKMSKELDLDAYEALKAEFKKQTVTVMRALEEAS